MTELNRADNFLRAALALIALLTACDDLSDLPPPPLVVVVDTGVLLTDSETTTTTDVTETADSATESDTNPDTASSGDTDTDDAEGGLFTFTGERPRNVLAISLDSTRRDWLSHFGGPAETPNLDALMDGGVVLANHRSCSNWTWASMVCVQASASEVDLNWIATGVEKELQRPPRSAPMIDQVLGERGYQTAMVSANTFFGASAGTAFYFDERHELNNAPAGVITGEAITFLNSLDDGPDQPWYLHLHYIDPHILYTPPDEYLEALQDRPQIPFDFTNNSGYNEFETRYDSLTEADRAEALEQLSIRYAGELTYADAQIGVVLEHARAEGLLDDTLVVFFTDHGEEFMEHSDMGHDDNLYELQNLSLAIFWAPGMLPGVWGGPTTHQDIWPTALRLLGEASEPGFRGVPVPERPTDFHRVAFDLALENNRGLVSKVMIEREGVKLIYSWDGYKELYHLWDDPGELQNLYASDDDEVLELWELLRPDLKVLDGLTAGEAIDIGP